MLYGDDGTGIFKNIQDYFVRELGMRIDVHDAILELHKGKFTTNAKNHSGEGIFFTSKMLHQFVILSDGSYFAGIDFMGQGFADEIFRVFQKGHPEIELIPINANETVLGMIKHVRANL